MRARIRLASRVAGAGVAAVFALLIVFFVLKIGLVGIVVLVVVGGGGWMLWRYYAALDALRAKEHEGGALIAGGKKRISLHGERILVDGSEYPLLNARAEAVADGAKEMSVGRVLGGTILDPGLGTLIGALWQRPLPVLVVTGLDWSETVAFRDLGSATLAARQINEAAARVGETA